MRAGRDQSLWLVIPAYNEAAVIGRVVADLVWRGYRVAVIDDGSTDNTGDEARAAGAITVTHAINLGQGAALQSRRAVSVAFNPLTTARPS
jgi:glycosyltransferase involved in cell wall biosynthesis